ncbi:hypothetical protein [Clostridium lacusfryxellense]|uniref:hypothetical protein n=1 Tax=Clostridium lacusfryxellense TaxID=205328 RepID=UPI001C0AF7ED|nr:hypothetical protein [Clostridium lacusfryxellense]MBU3110309.1 hypothetical protein [Clostridium lacusfryxellense]
MLNKNENQEILDSLEDRQLIVYDEDGQAVKTDSSKHFQMNEVCALMLPMVIEDVSISNRELSRRLLIDHRTISKYRNSDTFLRMLAIYTNKKVVGIRMLALDRLEKLLLDKKQNPNTIVKAVALALSHSERLAEIAMSAKSERPVSIADILKEIESM